MKLWVVPSLPETNSSDNATPVVAAGIHNKMICEICSGSTGTKPLHHNFYKLRFIISDHRWHWLNHHLLYAMFFLGWKRSWVSTSTFTLCSWALFFCYPFDQNCQINYPLFYPTSNFSFFFLTFSRNLFIVHILLKIYLLVEPRHSRFKFLLLHLWGNCSLFTAI